MNDQKTVLIGNMASEHPDLEMFRHELIDELEEQRFRHFAQSQDQEMLNTMRPTSHPAAISRESTATLRAMSEADNAHSWYGSNAAAADDEMDWREERTPTGDDTQIPIIVATDVSFCFQKVPIILAAKSNSSWDIYSNLKSQ